MIPGKLPSMLPAQSLLLFALCTAGILAFIFLIMIPSQQLSNDLDQDIVKLKERVEEQKILFPVFKNLLAKSAAPAPASLPAPAKSRLTRAEIGKVTQVLQKMAEKRGLTVKELALDLNSVADASGRLAVNLSARGQFMDFRGYLIDLAGLPFFESLDDIDIDAAEGGEEIKLKILMARES